MLTYFDVDVQIPHYIGLSRTDLKGKAVVLFDDEGHALCDGLTWIRRGRPCPNGGLLFRALLLGIPKAFVN